MNKSKSLIGYDVKLAIHAEERYYHINNGGEPGIFLGAVGTDIAGHDWMLVTPALMRALLTASGYRPLGEIDS